MKRYKLNGNALELGVWHWMFDVRHDASRLEGKRVRFGVFKMKSLGEYGLYGKDDYDGFILNFAYLIKMPVFKISR